MSTLIFNFGIPGKAQIENVTKVFEMRDAKNPFLIPIIFLLTLKMKILSKCVLYDFVKF